MILTTEIKKDINSISIFCELAFKVYLESHEMCPGVPKSFGTDSAMNTNYFSNTYSKNTNHFSNRVLLYRVVRKY